jgi:CTP synthase
MAKAHKYIFVVGGVMSGVGKGVAASSIGLLLQSRGFTVSPTKIDPYINVDAGTMNPTEHGEVFVLNDGYETDQDMGNYERFLNIDLSQTNYMTTGSVYQRVIARERNLEYGGKCVEVVPHIPLEVIARIDAAAKELKADVSIIEIGGTIGEYQNLLFLEAARMLKLRYPEDVAIILVSYLPVPSKVGEMKTKPTQYASRTLNGTGLQADYIIARSDHPLDAKRKEKLSLACSVPVAHVISAPDAESIYDIPLNFEKDRLGDLLVRQLRMRPKHTPELSDWTALVSRVHRSTKPLRIGIIGKYFASGDFVLSDSYLSVIEALKYAAYKAGRKPEIDWLASDDFEGKNAAEHLKALDAYDGIIVPGGFGSRGIEGKLAVIRHSREHKIPYFGLCYGMQLMVVEYARNVLGWKDANTTEIDRTTAHPVVDIMPDQEKKVAKGDFGGSMRLGAYPAKLKEGSIAATAYGATAISERHRHRFEVNPEFIADITKAGLVFSGTSPAGTLMEIAELPKGKHPFFLGTQFHPEFTARPLTSHPLFDAFVKAASKKK